MKINGSAVIVMHKLHSPMSSHFMSSYESDLTSLPDIERRYNASDMVEQSDNGSVISKSTMPSFEVPSHSTGCSQVKYNCNLCFNKAERDDSFIILSCNHIFHVHCLVQNHFDDICKYHIIDVDFISARKCMVCEKILAQEETMFLHNKFLSTTKQKISNHQETLTTLELKFQNLKEEIRACYEYKNKLEYEREKSKQIVTSLMTLL